MATLNVRIKHAGRVHDLTLDTNTPASVFKESVYQATGVPVDRMKVMIKGGVLKDDTDWKKVAPKEGQTFMVIGAAGELPKPPPKPIVFLEDMDDSELAGALAAPVGLKNLGNTCYMNATLQAMRAIPELETALSIYRPGPLAGLGGGVDGSPVLTRSLKDLYTGMKNTTDAFTPLAFLSTLRQVVPQFGEMAREGKGGMGGYAQQDAEECWVQITNALNALPGLPGPTGGSEAPIAVQSQKKFVEQFMMGEMRRELKCDEAPDEPPTITVEKVLKVECNISIATNYMHSGIMDALDQKIEKNSPSLGRDAVYTQRSRLSRIPANLAVHMVRFAWKRDINKKAKIMRRVKFPLELDVMDLVTDELKAKLLPVTTKLKQFERDRSDRRKVRRRMRVAEQVVEAAVSAAETGQTPMDITREDAGEGKEEPVATAELEEESVYRERERKELEALISEDLKKDVGSSVSGLYELVAIVTHKGAAADSGHYIGFVKKSVFHPVTHEPGKSSQLLVGPPDEDWYKFDDDKVSTFPVEKLETLSGGGEDSAAYVLLYRSKALA